jgi:hypothetical protein
MHLQPYFKLKMNQSTYCDHGDGTRTQYYGMEMEPEHGIMSMEMEPEHGLMSTENTVL